MKPVVLHVLPSFDTGGLGSLALQMIDLWPVPARHIAFGPKYRDTKPDLFYPFINKLGVGNVVQLERITLEQAPFWIDRMKLSIQKMLRGEGIANAIVYNFTDAGLSAQAIRRCGFYGEVAAHVGTVLPDNDMTRCIARARLALRFVPASMAVDKSLRAISDVGTKIAPVVWNGVNLEQYSGMSNRERAGDFGATSITFGFSGRMANPPVKDWGMLFDAFKIANIPGSQLRIAGDGKLRTQLENRAADIGDVLFTGQLDQAAMVEFLQGIDVFVMAALPIEGFSMALVEAIAAGCMIIGTDVPSVSEVFFAGGEAGFVANRAEDLAALMVLIKNNTGARRDNFQMVQRLQKMIDGKRMALAYSEIK